MNPRIIRIDASSLSYLHCFRKFYNNCILGLTRDKTINDIEYGSGWHIFRQIYMIDKDPMKAIAQAVGYFQDRVKEGMIIKEEAAYLNEGHLTQLCLRYVNEYSNERSWGKYSVLEHPVLKRPLIEETFSIPFYHDQETNISFLLQGTIDEIVHHPANYNIIGDDKTTRQWDTKKYLRVYNLKPQPLFYRLIIEILSEMPGGDWYKQLLEKRLGCRVNGIFLKEKVEECKFEQSDVFFFSDSQLVEMRAQLLVLVGRIIDLYKRGPTDFSVPYREGMFNGTCSGNFGTCDYSNACAAPKAEIYDMIIKSFSVKEYRPLSFREIKK